MNLKQKLALRSTLVCAVTLLLVFGSTFYFYRNYTIKYFYSKLEGRALLSAIIYLEKDELNKQKYREYESKYLNTLDTETIQIYNEADEAVFVPSIRSFPVTRALLKRIRKRGKETFMVNGRQYAGIYYEDNQGNFVIVSSGIDVTGRDRLYNLALILSLLFVVGILINYILNVILAKKTFRPFSSILQQVNTISTENLNSRLPHKNRTNDELNELISTLNMFLNRLESGVNNQKQFLKNVSHELKTPLAAIIGETELSLDREQTSVEYRQVLQKILKSSVELNSMVEGLLLISGLKNANFVPDFRVFRLDELLWEVLERLKFKYPNAEVNTLLEVEDSDLLELKLHPELVATAITNIVDNAIKFSFDHTITINIRQTETGQLALLVKNVGYDIQESELDKVFELFYRGANSKFQKPGHGIGLSLTKHIADFCNIKLSISSGASQGTEVQLVFPAV